MTFDDITRKLNNLSLNDSGRITPEESSSAGSSPKSISEPRSETRRGFGRNSKISSKIVSRPSSPEPLRGELFGFVVSLYDCKTRIVQTSESKEDSRMAVIDAQSICAFSGSLCTVSGASDLLKILDKIKVVQIEEKEYSGPLAEYKWHIKKYEVVGSDDQEGFQEMAVVVATPSPGYITVVSSSMARAMIIPFSSEITRHNLVIGQITQLRPHFFPELHGGQYMIKKDFEHEEDNKEVKYGHCCLFNARKLTEEEEKMVETNCRDVVDLSYEKAELYIRDAYIAVSRLEQYIQGESARFVTVRVPGRNYISKSSVYKIAVTLSQQQAHQCIFYQSTETWRIGSELTLRHADLYTIYEKMGNVKERQYIDAGVMVDSIKKQQDGTTIVELRASPRSRDMFDLLNKINFDFSGTLFTVGPSDDQSDTIAMNLEINFARFFDNKPLFDAWRGFSEADSTPIANLHEEFLVNGVRLDSSQTVALRTAISRKGFTCVEAPPGSGKTFLIASIVASKKQQEKKIEGRICVSATTNCAITNALDVTHKQFEDIPKTRQYSKVAEGQLTEESSKISLLHMALSPQNHVNVSKHQKLAGSLAKYHRATQDLTKISETDIQKGLKKVERLNEAKSSLKSNFLKAFCPFLIGSTCELVARRICRNEDSAALAIKEGCKPDLSKCITHLILDEASQISPHMALAVYVSLPVATKITLIGDTRQLPPYSQLDEGSLAQKLIGRGELQRLQEGKGTNRTELSTIYRCHPRIIDLLLKPIYGPQLTAGTQAIDRNLAAEANLPRAEDPHSSPVLFVQVDGHCERGYNPEEAEAVLKFIDDLKKKGITGEDVAVVCNHRAQRERLSAKLKGQGNIGHLNLPVTVHTVDSFQGKEAKVVLVLTTKTCSNPWDIPSKTLGFVANPNRGTVAVSRSQHAVYIFGQWDKLVQTDFWRQFVPSIVENKALVTSDWKQASEALYNSLTNPSVSMNKSGRKTFFMSSPPWKKNSSPRNNMQSSPISKMISGLEAVKFKEI